MRLPVITVCMLMTAMSTTTIAEPYVGFGVGTASYQVDLTSAGGGSYDDSGTGIKLYSGYAFNRYFAAELDIYNFAEASAGSIETSPGSGTFVSATASMKGIGAYAVGMYPVSKSVNLIAKLGMLNWDADLGVNNNTATNDGTDAAYALAVSYAFTKELLVVAEWESFNTDNPEVSLLSAGFRFNFR
jgi:OmpA-OmpF porin, OOP family